jgi:hypothetical protein
MAVEDYAGAVTMFGEALRFNPADSESVINRAVAYLFLGSVDYALTDVNTAIQHNPTAWYPWKIKGDVLSAKGDLSGAEGAYQEALAFAQGMNKMTVQHSLTDIRLRRSTQARQAQAQELPSSSSTIPENTSVPQLTPVISTGSTQQMPLIPDIPPYPATSPLPTTTTPAELVATPAPATTPTLATTSTQARPAGPILFPAPVTQTSNPSVPSPAISTSTVSTRAQPISPLSSQASPSTTQQSSATIPRQTPAQAPSASTSTTQSGASATISPLIRKSYNKCLGNLSNIQRTSTNYNAIGSLNSTSSTKTARFYNNQ